MLRRISPAEGDRIVFRKGLFGRIRRGGVMTGQLVVVPAGLPRDPYERLALTLDDGREIRFRDVRKFGRVGLYEADDDPFDGIGPEPLDPRFTPPALAERAGPAVGDDAILAGYGVAREGAPASGGVLRSARLKVRVCRCSDERPIAYQLRRLNTRRNGLSRVPMSLRSARL